MIKHTGTVPLETKRLLLRRFELEDAGDVYHNWASDHETLKYLAWGPYKDVKMTTIHVKEWLILYEHTQYYNWAICLKENNQAIGTISVEMQQDRTGICEVGYCLSKDYWGKGIMPEALHMIINYLFYKVGYHRIIARYDILNVASGKVMQKVGMRFERIIYRSNKRKDGSYYDCVIYGINKADWKRV